MTPETLDELNALHEAVAFTALQRCCGATRWVEQMVAGRPYASVEALFRAADAVWATMAREDILEAFSHHPRIGASLTALREKFAATAGWSAGEQSGVGAADEPTLERLRDGNLAYEARFGHIFIVCATGKTAAQMLALLEARLGNEPDEELAIAAAEQAKITRIRLDKLTLPPLGGASAQPTEGGKETRMARSPITTHVLDTARGGPAAGVPIRLERRGAGGAFAELARGTTDADGRITDLLEPGSLQTGVYRITFDTGVYFAAQDVVGFYPEVPVIFEIRATGEHYHVPLLISPFGFSTYRGS